MPFTLRFFTFIILFFSFSAQATAPACINRDANPREQTFINQIRNPTPGGFIEMWKNERLGISTTATVCIDCGTSRPEPLAPAPVQDFKAIVSASTGPGHEETEDIKIEKGFFGGYFYRDIHGKKIRLSKKEALNLKSQAQARRLNEKINSDIDSSTQKTFENTTSQMNDVVSQRLSERRANALEALVNQQIVKTNEISQECVERTLSKLRPNGNKRICENDKGSAPDRGAVPCITEEIVSYMTWSMNKVFDCINDRNDPLNSDLFFKKINRESNLNFWIESDNGRGLGQLTFTGMQEVMGGGYDPVNQRHFKYEGRKMLEKIMNKNKAACQQYYKIANPNLSAKESMYPRPYNDNKCSQMSLDAGIQRNLLASIALYKFYRDEQPSYSSVAVLKNLGIPASNPDYSRMKNLLALMSYSSINSQGARAIAESRKHLMNPKISYEEFEDIIKGEYDNKKRTWQGGHPRADYLRAIDDSYRSIQKSGESLKCTGF